MFAFVTKLLLAARSRLKSRARLEAEILVLRQQVIVLSRRSRSRVWLRNIDRLIFVWLYRLFPSILDAITVVKPETVIRWHRRGFRAYWRWKSRRRGGLRARLSAPRLGATFGSGRSQARTSSGADGRECRSR
jgi:hypothetical protein